jgi:DNA-binding beta-propeller fold protein YncE
MTLDRTAPTAGAPAPMVTATIPVGGESDAVAANLLTGSVYVANQLDNTVSAISGPSQIRLSGRSPDKRALMPRPGSICGSRR